MLLVQHFGQQRLGVKPLTEHRYSENGYECTIVGYQISFSGLENQELKILDALEFFNRRATPEFLARKLAQLREVMARTNESNQDISLLIETYSEHLEQYPPDVVAYVIDKAIATKKWFPLVSELRSEMESLVRFRKTILDAFAASRNPMIEQKPVQAIEADPRLSIHWKQLSKSEWLPQHFEWAIEEVSDMLELAKQNPNYLNVSMWEITLEELTIELAKIAQIRGQR